MIVKRVVLKGRMPRVNFQLSASQSALLMPVGDIHFGAPNFPLQHFTSHLQWGIDRGAYFLGMGDYLDLSSATERKVFKTLRDSTQLNLDQKIRQDADDLLEIMRPSIGSWIGLLTGNHTWNFQDGTNLDQYLCRGLDCDYLGDFALLRIVCKDSPANHPEGDLIVVAHHGTGGGTTIGGQLLKPEQLLKWTQADLILMGHTHAKIIGGLDRIYVTPDGKTSHRTTMVARTGAFLKAYAGTEPFDLSEPAYLSAGSYVEKRAMMPASMGGLCFSIGVERIEGSKFYRPVVHYSV